MPAEYLINIGEAQVYLTAQGERCSRGALGTGPIYFVRCDTDGVPLLANWDIGLSEFSEEQRKSAQVWARARD
ncbi:hypothetical protein GT347_20065 [Xylophilus rhododendri]|uniref:Uncharacterized protein n=1 Tax=Xylophilus rhododendri TaxID=2697032 RepID=A0A857J7Q6_9BURK|nr:hypothetical protein [Xylophilus rhododendri]QHJ00071.1 hypothetical protein GT347_20065 [Xylophilus rhododendri]